MRQAYIVVFHYTNLYVRRNRPQIQEKYILTYFSFYLYCSFWYEITKDLLLSSFTRKRFLSKPNYMRVIKQQEWCIHSLVKGRILR